MLYLVRETFFLDLRQYNRYLYKRQVFKLKSRKLWKPALVIGCLLTGILVLVLTFTAGRETTTLKIRDLKSLPEAVKFSEVYQKSPMDILRLRIRNGSSGHIKETDNPQDIENFIRIIKDVTFEKDINQEDRNGWSYSVELYGKSDTDSWFRVGFGGMKTFSLYNSGGKEKIVESAYYNVNNSDKSVIDKQLKWFYNSFTDPKTTDEYFAVRPERIVLVIQGERKEITKDSELFEPILQLTKDRLSKPLDHVKLEMLKEDMEKQYPNDIALEFLYSQKISIEFETYDDKQIKKEFTKMFMPLSGQDMYLLYFGDEKGYSASPMGELKPRDELMAFLFNKGIVADTTKRNTNTTHSQDFAIYAVKYLSPFEATKVELDRLELEEKPVITSNDLKAYYRKWHAMLLPKETADGIAKRLRNTSGIPVVIIAEGKRIYLCTAWTMLSSLVPPDNLPLMIVDGVLGEQWAGVYEASQKQFKEDTGPLGVLAIEKPRKEKDPRDDRRVMEALKRVGILK